MHSMRRGRVAAPLCARRARRPRRTSPARRPCSLWGGTACGSTPWPPGAALWTPRGAPQPPPTGSAPQLPSEECPARCPAGRPVSQPPVCITWTGRGFHSFHGWQYGLRCCAHVGSPLAPPDVCSPCPPCSAACCHQWHPRPQLLPQVRQETVLLVPAQPHPGWLPRLWVPRRPPSPTGLLHTHHLLLSCLQPLTDPLHTRHLLLPCLQPQCAVQPWAQAEAAIPWRAQPGTGPQAAEPVSSQLGPAALCWNGASDDIPPWMRLVPALRGLV